MVVAVEYLFMSLYGYGVKHAQGRDLLSSPGGAVEMLPAPQSSALWPVAHPLCEDCDVTKSASLRVYSPQVSGSSDPVPGFVRTYGILSEAEGDSHLTVEWEGRRLVCPRNLRLRVLESTVAFANAFSGLGGGLIPESAAQAADRELKAYHRENPEHRSHILTSAWHVPVRWFALFVPSEKQIYDGPDNPRLRYRTGLEQGQDRIARAHRVLIELGVFAGPAEELNQVISWLDQFPAGSMLELDYGDVSELFDPQELVLDDSCEQVNRSIDALEAGDMMQAGECYGRVVTRWAPAFSVTFSN